MSTLIDRFTVVCQRAGRQVDVGPGQSILEALEAAAVTVPFSCREGFCGSCETTVIEGTPDHWDEVLSESQRQTGASMMICVSRSLSARLVLDL